MAKKLLNYEVFDFKCLSSKYNKHNWRKNMKKFFPAILALVVLLLMAASVSAESGATPVKTSQNTKFATAFWSIPYGQTSITVSETQDGNTTISVSKQDGLNNYTGSITTSDNVFKNADVNSASLSAVQIPVTDHYSGNTDTYTVTADWTGTGDADKGHDIYNSGSVKENNGYKLLINSDYVSKYANVTGSINGNDLGTSTFGWMELYKYMGLFKGDNE